jgi:hypothetical protein
LKNNSTSKTLQKITWSRYETEVFDACKIAFRNARVTKNEKIRGKFSGRSRQIDILIKENIGGKEILIVVDCKLYSQKADIKHVESFIGMIADIGADKGLMVAEKGYTESALKRAYYNPQHIELDIYSLAEVKDRFHGDLAIPYAGGYGTILTAPFGWIVDATRSAGYVCLLYQRGLTLVEAGAQKEVAYINFWIKENTDFHLDDLFLLQEANLKGLKINALNYQQSIQRNDAKTKIRIADIQGYPAKELTGFVEFKEFIFFCVWFSREVNLKRNIRKLESIMSSIIPLKVKNETAD